MVKIKAFKGVRPAKEYAAKVASKPYDVLDSQEAREEAKGNDLSFLHIIKPEIDLPAETDAYSNEVYDKAKENFDKFLDKGILRQDDHNCLYIYRQKMDQYEQTGLVAASAIDDYFDDYIKKHEHTRKEKERDRINHMKTSGIHSGPVFLTYPDEPSIDQKIQYYTENNTPENDFTADDGVQHTLWVIDDEQLIKEITELFNKEVPKTYIADGHHRAASSAKVGKELREEQPNYDGTEDFNYFLTVLFPAGQLNVFDYNRVVKDLNGLEKDDFISKLEEKFEVEELGRIPYRPKKPHEFGMFLDKNWYLLEAKEGTFNENDPVERLDVSILQNNVMDNILGISDPRTDNRIDFVGGIRGLEELERRVANGEMAVAFALYPVTVQQLIEISDANKIMPPKSTWFEPKLRSGLIVHRFG